MNNATNTRTAATLTAGDVITIKAMGAVVTVTVESTKVMACGRIFLETVGNGRRYQHVRFATDVIALAA